MNGISPDHPVTAFGIMLTEHEICSLLFELNRKKAEPVPRMGVGAYRVYSADINKAVNALREAVGLKPVFVVVE